MKKIGIITYDHPHRKTMDVISGLLLNGVDPESIELLLITWKEQKARHPLCIHRPKEIWNNRTYLTLFKTHIYNIGVLEQFDIILLAGAGILKGLHKLNVPIVNSHPGYLPNIRGLDALKWAIYDDQHIGATTHYVNQFYKYGIYDDFTDELSLVDNGRYIDRKIVPVYFEDTFHSVAQRLYETEIRMLVDIVVRKDIECDVSPPNRTNYPIRKRMPLYLEPVMMERFNQLRKHSKSIYNQ